MNGLVVICLTIFVYCVIFSVRCDESSKREKEKEKLPPCQACRSLVNSFNKGIERTSRGKFEGGDADWEEKKLKSYSNSEIRLVEIQEELCKDLDRGKDQCLLLMEQHEEPIEQWWLHSQKDEDFFTSLCINRLKVCCPENTFGPDCSPCPGGIERPCRGNGKCKGSGTRKGNGECKCEAGYSGKTCGECTIGHYLSYEDDEKMICSECHRSCQGHCWESGSKGCEVCKSGWSHSPEYGCQDVDECHLDTPACSTNEFCVNLEGSFQCIECHKNCDGCNGDGPDFCIECRQGSVLKDGICIDQESYQRSWQMRAARYITYIGMCVATFIIFKKSTRLASVVGVIVGVYIAASEYTVSDSMVDVAPRLLTM